MNLICRGLLLLVLSLGLARAAEPVSYKLVHRDGRTLIQSSDGQLIPWCAYSVAIDHSTKHWALKLPGFVQAGVNLYQLPVWPKPNTGFFGNPFWSPDGQPYDPGTWEGDPDALAKILIRLDPQARFIVRFGAQPGSAWQAAHKREYVALDDQPVTDSKRLTVNPSLASNLYIQGLAQLVRDVVRWCEAKPWRDRIVGYSLYPYGEGVTEGPIEGQLFDHSAPMQQAFGQAVPTAAEWRAKRAKLLHWPDPAETQRERDYFRLQERLFARYVRTMIETLADATHARPVLKGGDFLKQPMQGWILLPEFTGNWQPDSAENYPHLLLASGSIKVQQLLDLPGLDMLQTPGIYFNRALGFAWDAEGVTDSLTLRRKVNFMEADMRTWIEKGPAGESRPRNPNPDAGTFQNAAEMRAGFDRTLAWSVSRNQMFYYMSVSGQNWWYDDPVIYAQIAKQRAAIDALAETPWRETPDAICLVIDDEAALWEDFSAGFDHLAVFRQLQEGLALCGIPYRVHLLQDLARDDFPDYKVWLFPNLFRVDDGVLALLKKKVLHQGHVAIFGPGTGITDGHIRSAAGATKLLGVPMELVLRTAPRRVLIGGDHPIVKRLPSVTYGEDYPFGPILVPQAVRFDPTNTTARALGSGWFFYGLDRPGLFVNQFGKDYTVVFSAAVPLPPELLRECARYAGCNVWSEETAVVYACDTFVAVHAIRSGRYTLHLPRTCRVLDFYTHKRLAAHTDQITVEINAPETRMFLLE